MLRRAGRHFAALLALVACVVLAAVSVVPAAAAPAPAMVQVAMAAPSAPCPDHGADKARPLGCCLGTACLMFAAVPGPSGVGLPGRRAAAAVAFRPAWAVPLAGTATAPPDRPPRLVA